jgi:hypothetical protein
MKIEKLDPMLCLAFDLAKDCSYPISILFVDVIELAFLSKDEIANLSEWEECTSVQIIGVEPKRDRRWRERTI